MSTVFDKIFQAAPGFADQDDGGLLEVPALERAGFDLNDLGNAARLRCTVAADLVWCQEWGWGVWKDTHYDFEAGEVLAFQVATQLQAIIEAEAVAHRDAEVTEFECAQEMALDIQRTPAKRRGSIDLESAEKNIRAARYQRLHKHALDCGNIGPINRALTALQPLVRVRLSDLNSDGHMLNCRNGLVDLRRVAEDLPEAATPEELAAHARGFLVPNDRSTRPTRVTACDFVPGAVIDKFQVFLDLIVPARHMQTYLQRLCGQLVSGHNAFQIAILFQGEGANGKSTLMNILAAVLGTHVEACKIEMFLATELRSSSAATPDEAQLPGARAYVASEPEPGSALSDAKVKAFTGGDPRKSRALHAAPFEWKPGGVPVLAFNRLPQIKGDSFGTRRRIALMPFTQNLRDPAIPARSAAEVEAEMIPEHPAILNWMLDGYREAKALGGLHPPPEASDLKDALLSDSDPVGEFIKACLVEDAKGRVKTSELHGVFEVWANETGNQVWRARTVKSALIQKGFRTITVKGYAHYAGLVWNTEAATGDYLGRIGASA